MYKIEFLDEQSAANAVAAVGLTIGCVDVLVQQNRDGRHPEFIILETNQIRYSCLYTFHIRNTFKF